jgi:cell fate (sporulation/competence/biofilm development) regulator YmcA (YheA/YmcA/DUF963 family)
MSQLKELQSAAVQAKKEDREEAFQAIRAEMKATIREMRGIK